ncbi:MAG: hypothetical protein J6U86_01445 [Clostridia bacterium]|nr:hypothetical protein [Clostridia bacterium]
MKIKFKIGFFTILLLLTTAITMGKYFPAMLCSVAIHEIGHIFMAKIRRIDLRELSVGIFGASLTTEHALFSYFDEVLLCLGGPLFNYASALIWITLTKCPPSSFFVVSSLGLGTLNMLPIKGFDGGRIATAILSFILSIEKANSIIKFLSFVFIFSLWCFSLYLLMKKGASMTVFVFSVSMFVKIFIPDVL